MGMKLYDRIIKCPSVHPSFRPSIIGMKLYDKVLLLSVCPSVRLSSQPSVSWQPAFRSTMRWSSTTRSIYGFFIVRLVFPFCPSACSSVLLSFLLSVCVSICPSACPSVHWHQPTQIQGWRLYSFIIRQFICIRPSGCSIEVVGIEETYTPNPVVNWKSPCFSFEQFDPKI